MKTLKHNISILIFICISIINGCGDNFVEPVNTETVALNAVNSPMSFEEGVYNEKFTLNAGETKTFDYGNTNLILIHSYNISKCSINSRDLSIRSSMQADSTSLPCNWKKHGNFAFENISIKNISGQTRSIKVYLVGYTIGK